MKTGERKVGAASCRVRQSNAIPQNMRANVREVVDLEVPVPEQGKGYATTLMHSVCREADKAGIVLMLTPYPYGDHINLSQQQLIDWYTKSFGFQAIQAEPSVLLARMPGSTPRMLTLKPVTQALYKEQTK